jgi:hypothetical protein
LGSVGVAASYQAIEPENHAIPTYEAKVPQMAPSELKVGSVVRFCGEVQKYVVIPFFKDVIDLCKK